MPPFGKGDLQNKRQMFMYISGITYTYRSMCLKLYRILVKPMVEYGKETWIWND